MQEDLFTLEVVLSLNEQKNILTIDLEDWFAVDGFESFFTPNLSQKAISNLENNTEYLLNRLKYFDINATFFVLSKLANYVPDLIKEISTNGHEIALHGYNHIRIDNMNESQFTIDIEKSLKILSRFSIEVIGYRAPQFSINKHNLHYLEILKNLGLVYDSSIYPIAIHPNYGMNESKTMPYQILSDFYEFPIATAKYFGKNIPCGGGAYFRFYNYSLFKKLFKRCQYNNGVAVFYIHPWEFSHTIPKDSISKNMWFRQHYNIKNNKVKFEKLLNDFKFVSIREFIRLNKKIIL